MNPFRLIALLAGMTALSVAAQDGPPRLLIDPKGHSGFVKEALFRTTTNELITLGDDKSIRFWDLESGELTKTMWGKIGEGSSGQLFAGAISADERYLAVAGLEAVITVIDLETGKIVALLKGHESSVNALAFSGDGLWLASGSGDNTVRTWDLSPLTVAEGGTLLEIPVSQVLDKHTEPVYALDFSDDGLRIVSGADDDLLVLWGRGSATDPFEVIATGDQHTKDVSSVAFSIGGVMMVSGGLDHRLNLWNGKTGEFVETIDEEMGSVIAAVDFSPDGQRVVASSQLTPSGLVAIYDLSTKKRTLEFSEPENRIRCVAWHPGQNLIVTAGGENVIDLWRPDADPEAGIKAGDVVHELSGAGLPNYSVAFSDAGGPVVAFGRSYDPEKEEGMQDLELAFDFANLEFVESGDYTRTYTEIESVVLARDSGYRLSIGEGRTLEVDHSTDGLIHAYSFLPDGASLVVGCSYALKTFESNPNAEGNYPLLNQFIGHFGEVRAVSASADGRYLASASTDQTVRLWNLQTGELLASLFVAEDREWVCWTPSGHYHASPGGERYVGWYLNPDETKLGEFFPSSVFRDAFHRPDLVTATVEKASFAAALDGTGAEEVDIDSLLPPRIEWVSPKRARGTSEGTTFTVKAELHSPNGELQELKVLLNGKALVGYDLSNGTELNFEEEIELNPGENRLTLFARNIHAGHTSEERVIHVAAPGNEPDPDKPTDDGLEELTKPNLYVLAVGISAFADGDISALEYCDDDATAMADFFAGQEGGLFKKTEVKLLVNEEATEANIQAGLDWLEKSATQKDFVVLFLASHGCNDEKGKFYMIPHDCDPDNLRATGVAWEDFGEVLGNLPSRVLMFLDTCHSGRLGANLFTMANGTKTRSFTGLKSSFDNTEAIRELTSDEVGVVIMAASTGNESSLENEEWGHGAFTTAALAGLNGEADLNDDGIVHLVELDFFVAEKVKELTEGEQHPTTVKPSTISRLPVAAVVE